MTLPASGPLTIAQILAEIGDSFPVTIPNANWRTLAGKPTGALVIPDDFWGKSWSGVTEVDNRTTFAASHSGVAFGATDAKRWIVVIAVHGDTASNPGTTPTCTIGGTSARRILAHTSGDGIAAAVGVAMFAAQPSGTSGVVDVDWGSLNTSIVVLRVIGYDLATDFDVGGNDSGSASESINIPANGLLIGAVARTPVTAVIWTNLTARGTDSSGKRRSWGWDTQLPVQTGRAVSYSPHSGSQGQNCFVVASYELD